MSVHVSSAVWRVNIGTTEKLVLLKLADCCDDDGRNAWPSVARIARECCMSERTVARTLRALRLAGLIVVQEAARRHSSVTYELHPENAEQLEPRPRVRVLRPAKMSPLKSTSRPAKLAVRPDNGDTVRPDNGDTLGLPRVADKSSVEPSSRGTVLEPSRATRAPQPPPTLSARATRALNGSRRRRDVDALETESPDDRYFRGRYGAILRARLEER